MAIVRNRHQREVGQDLRSATTGGSTDEATTAAQNLISLRRRAPSSG